MAIYLPLAATSLSAPNCVKLSCAPSDFAPEPNLPSLSYMLSAADLKSKCTLHLWVVKNFLWKRLSCLEVKNSHKNHSFHSKYWCFPRKMSIYTRICIYLQIYMCVCMSKVFKRGQCFASFLFLNDTPEKGSEPSWGKFFRRITVLLTSNCQPRQIPHVPAEEAEAETGRVKGQRQELLSMTNTTLANPSPSHGHHLARPHPWGPCDGQDMVTSTGCSTNPHIEHFDVNHCPSLL